MKRFKLVTILILSALAAASMTLPLAAQEDRPEIKRNEQGVPVADILFPKPTPIAVIIDDFMYQTGEKIILKGDTQKLKIAFSGSQLTPEEFLDSISSAHDLKWTKTESGYELWDRKNWEDVRQLELMETKVFVPVHITAKYLADAIKQSNILTPKHGSVAVDQRVNKVFVTDLPEKLALVQDLMNLIDLPQYTRIFYIRYVPVAEIVDKIQDMKSEAGTIESDEIARIIIVRDVLANIQRMESMIELLDVRQPRRVYNLNSIGAEGKGIEQIETNLQEIMTEGAYYSIDAERGLLILEDSEVVHEDVERFLKIFDRPIDQVRIEAELLDVDQSHLLDYGSKFAYSDDLEAAVADGFVDGAASYFVGYEDKFPVVTIGSSGANFSFWNKYIRFNMQALLNDSNTRVLLRPRVTVKNREKASFIAGSETPISVVQQIGNSTTNNDYSVSTQNVPSGLTVEITPTISPTGLVEMEILIDNSTARVVEVPTGITETVGGERQQRTVQGVEKTVDTIQTVLIIPDGETRVISGLIDRVESETEAGVPFLVKIPVIGPMIFGKTSKSTAIRNLLFFITPTVIREKPIGDIVAYQFDELESGGEWVDPEQEALLRAQSRQNFYTDDASTTGGLPRRFDAPEPEPLPAEEEMKMDSDASTTSLKNLENSEAAMRQAVLEAGGTIPKFRQEGLTGLSGDLSEGTAKDDTSTATESTTQGSPGGEQEGDDDQADVKQARPRRTPPAATGTRQIPNRNVTPPSNETQY
ncbi:MAG: secretin N-terminal domain-containing protein [Candidatus Sumerlaeia bacterium]